MLDEETKDDGQQNHQAEPPQVLTASRPASPQPDGDRNAAPPPLPAKQVIHLKAVGPADGLDGMDVDQEPVLEQQQQQESNVTTAFAPIVFTNKASSELTVQLDDDGNRDAAGATTATTRQRGQDLKWNHFVSPLPFSKKKMDASFHPKKLSFAKPNYVKSSSVSLIATVRQEEEEAGDDDPHAAQGTPELLQRRNSIHAVPYVDVNDPDTRARMERYKEERRSLLRAKYKVEDYKKKPPVCTPRKSLQEPVPAPRSQRKSCPVVSSSTPHNEGLIEDDVNVKERAALFNGRAASSAPAPSVATTAEKPPSPNKIKNMAAFFEQQKPWSKFLWTKSKNGCE